jgi:FixJ family two-component response regulator
MIGRRSAQSAASVEVVPGQPDTAASGETSTFYVVDESWSVRNSLKRLLRSYGFRVFTFASGSECLERIGKDRPDCAIVDTALPDVTPEQLQRRLKEAAPNLSLIAMSAHSEGAFLCQVRDAGAQAVLCKPIEEQELLAQLERALGRELRQPNWSPT